MQHKTQSNTATIVYDDDICVVDILPDYRGYWVRVDEDDESAVHCFTFEEALDVAEEIRETFEGDNGQFGVGA